MGIIINTHLLFMRMMVLFQAKNPHVHLVYSDRIIEHDRGSRKRRFCRQRTGYKKDMDIVGSKRNEWIDKNRKLLADKINEFLKSKSIDEKLVIVRLRKEELTKSQLFI